MLVPRESPEPTTRIRYWSWTRFVVSKPTDGSSISSVTFVPPNSTLPYFQIVARVGLFVVEGFGDTSVRQTSRKTRSVRASVVGGG